MIVKPGSNTDTKTIIIIGVQRGGTSMVAGVARELGINLGANLGNNHEDPEFITTDLGAIRKVVERRNSDHMVWGWKMPHTSEYILQLLPKIRNPFVIVVFRNLVSIVESQMRRSDADFQKAFAFSATRTEQVSSVTKDISCPLMVVNYEQAIAKPSSFVDEMSNFLHLNPSSEERGRAIEMINPARGYARMKREDWTATVSKEQNFDLNSVEEIFPARQNALINVVDNWLHKNGQNPRVVFTGLSGRKRVHIAMLRRGAPAHVKICVDTAGGFTNGLTDSIQLYQGKNIVTIDAENINGILIYPQFDGPVSNTGLFRVFADKA